MLSYMSKANLVGRDGVEDTSQVVLQVEIRPFHGVDEESIHIWGDCGVARFTCDEKPKEFPSWISNIPPPSVPP